MIRAFYIGISIKRYDEKKYQNKLPQTNNVDYTLWVKLKKAHCSVSPF
jgi:hypothetical protein